jgi:catalase
VGALTAAGAKVEVVSTALGVMATDGDRPIEVMKTFLTTASVLYDAVVVPGGTSAGDLARNADAVHFVRESFRHAKPIGAANDGIGLLQAAALPDVDLAGKRGKPLIAARGVVTVHGSDLKRFTAAFADAILAHRHFDRDLAAVPS